MHCASALTHAVFANPQLGKINEMKFILQTLAAFCVIIVVSILIGVAVGVVSSVVLKRLNRRTRLTKESLIQERSFDGGRGRQGGKGKDKRKGKGRGKDKEKGRGKERQGEQGGLSLGGTVLSVGGKLGGQDDELAELREGGEGRVWQGGQSEGDGHPLSGQAGPGQGLDDSREDSSFEGLRRECFQESTISPLDSFELRETDSFNFDGSVQAVPVPQPQTRVRDREIDQHEVKVLKASFENLVSQQIHVMVVSPMVAYLAAEVR